MVRANSDASSPQGSSPVAAAASVPASREPNVRSVRMTRRLIVWTTVAMSASVGGTTLTKRGVRPWSVRSRDTPCDRHQLQHGGQAWAAQHVPARAMDRREGV
jgi:hypothetical protein